MKQKSVGRDVLAKGKSEEEVVKENVDFLVSLGWRYRKLDVKGIPVKRRNGNHILKKNPMKGLPDGLFVHPIKKRSFWVEFKKEVGGVVSPQQKAWHEYLRAGGHLVLVVSSLESMKKQLRKEGLLEETPDSSSYPMAS